MHDATYNSVLNSATHGRQRRQQRNISKVDLQRARRYGMKEPARNGRIKYTYGGVVFIYDPYQNREVTSFRSSDAASHSSGTKCSYPIILQKKEEYEDPDIVLRHYKNRASIYRRKEKWTSHSVLVVDMSGSMRRDDVNGAKCRSDGVWMTLARNYAQKPLEAKTRTKYDLVSVVVMKDDAQVVIRCEPTDWVLYNRLIDMREWTELRPEGPGNYMPALDAAEELLDINQLGSCPLSLLFFSDGKPSDSGDFSSRMGKIASKFGRRLNFCCIGMADKNENFCTLNDMVTEAESYGAVASFNKPSLDADSLSNIITSLASSLTTSRTEMTDMKTGRSKVVRTDVLREKACAPDDLRLTHDWRTFKSRSGTSYVRRIWSWACKRNDYVYLADPRCIECFKDTKFSPEEGMACPQCRACYFCYRCMIRGKGKHTGTKECKKWLQDRRSGELISKSVPSFSVAMKRPIFGEGAERIVHKFRFLDDDDNFVGPKMVAKESRFVEEEGSYDERMDYHSEFMRTQALASEFAVKFNAALDDIVNHFDRKYRAEIQEWVRKMPRIKFLEAHVVEAVTEGGDELNILIEPMLEGNYEKFNSNMGYVKGQSGQVNKADLDILCSLDSLSNTFDQLNVNSNRGNGLGGGLGAIEEGSEDEEDSEDEEIICQKRSLPAHGSYDTTDVQDRDFPQAFSHFSFEKSKEHLMVVDLQGVLKIRRDGTKQYLLTDPVIHKKEKRRGKSRHKLQHWTFGRTDKGTKGMNAFFMTHKCNEVCRVLGLKKHKHSP